jgi:hypothetical protein
MAQVVKCLVSKHKALSTGEGEREGGKNKIMSFAGK